MHSDLKLALALVPAAALLQAGRPDGLLMYVVRDRLEIGLDAFGVLTAVTGVGGLAAVAAAIRVDRHIPHTMMAAGAVFGAFGITVVLLSNSLAQSALGVLVASIGHAAVGSHVFFAVAVKGAVRLRGTLIGALGMAFTLPLGSSHFYEWPFESPVLVVSITFVLALAGAALLLLHLPRTMGSYVGPIGNLSATLSLPATRRSVAWAAVMFAVVSFVVAVAPTGQISLMMNGDHDVLESQLQTASVFTGVGVLAWGIAADRYPARRLLLLAGLLLLPATGVLWVLNSLSATAIGVSILGIAQSGLICLPWILLADLLPKGHFAKIAVAITLVGGFLGSTLGSTAIGLASSFWGFGVVFWTAPVGGIIAAFVATRLPGSLSPDVLLTLDERRQVI